MNRLSLHIQPSTVKIVAGLFLVSLAASLGGCTVNDLEGVMDRITMPLSGAKPVSNYDYSKKQSKTPPGKYRNTYIKEPGQSYRYRSPK